jgi:hypothetical protein
VNVRIEDLEAGNVPAISVMSGEACSNPVAIPLRPGSRPWSPGGRKVVAVLPVEPARVKEHKILTNASWVVLVALIAAVLAAFAVGWVPAAVACLIYALLVVVGDARWIAAKPKDRDFVTLVRVHREFARAVEEQYGMPTR